MHGWSGSLINAPYGAYLDHCYAWNLQIHFLRVFVANFKNDAIYVFYPESFCDNNLAIRKVFAFSDSDSGICWSTQGEAWQIHLWPKLLFNQRGSKVAPLCFMLENANTLGEGSKKMLPFIRTKCKICFICVRFNCKKNENRVKTGWYAIGGGVVSDA